MEKININGIDEVIYKHTCKNGFEIYMWKYDLSDEISMSLTVKYGSIHTHFKKDGKDIKVPNGIAHFLEHIKFNEEDGTTANDFYSKIGSYANAYTSYDNTSYEVTTNKDVKTNLNHLLYYVFNPYFKEELIEKEKGIIKEEANGSINNAYAKGYHKLLENIYNKNPRKYLITGTPEDVESITLKDVLNVYNNFYVPGNMFLTIGGNIDPDEVVSIVEDFFKDKTYDKFDAEVIMPHEDLSVLKISDIIHDNVSKNKMYLAYKYDRKLFKQDDFMIKMAFNRILTANFGTISDFKEELTSKKIIDELGSAVIGDDENVVVIFEVSADDLEKVRKLIDNKMNNLSLDEETFNRIKKVKIASLILGYDRPSGVVYNITRDLLEYDKILNDIKDLQENSKLEDVLEVIKLLDNTNYTYLEIIPN